MEEEKLLRIKVQETILHALAKKGFFTKYVFHGGSCLFFFYDNVRWSEDLDFVKNRLNPGHVANDLSLIEKALKSACRDIKLLIPEVESVGLKMQKESERFVRFILKLSEKGKREKTKINVKIAEIKAHLVKTVLFEGDVVAVESAEELMADKIVAIAARGKSLRMPKVRDILDFYYLGEGVEVLKTDVHFSEIKRLVNEKIEEYELEKSVIKEGVEIVMDWLGRPESIEELEDNFIKYSTSSLAKSFSLVKQYCSQVKEYFGKKFPEVVNFILEDKNQCVTKNGLHLKNC